MCAADRGFTWSDEETSLLLRLWGDNEAQSELTGNKRNFVVYEKISECMGTAGFCRTASQCREKIKRMKREYTLTKSRCEKSGSAKKNMRFFDEFERILLEKKSSREDHESEKGDSLSRKRNSRRDRKLKKIVPKSTSSPPKITKITQESSNAWIPAVAATEDDGPPVLLDIRSLTPTQGSDETEDSEKFKNSSNSSRHLLKDVTDSISAKFRRHHANSAANIVRQAELLEKERESAMERIRKMWQDYETKRNADEKEHELKVMALFQNIASKVNTAMTS